MAECNLEKQFNHVYEQIVGAIEIRKRNVVNTVNAEMVQLYWQIGQLVVNQILKGQKAEYGKSVVEKLSKELTMQYGKGYSVRNLFQMIKMYEVFPDEGILQTLSAKLTWSHFTLLITIEDDIKRDFYSTMCINERWSVRSLKERMQSMLYERTALSKKSEETIINDLKLLKEENKMSTDLFLKDPYVLDFLQLQDTYSEKDLENAILTELERFLLEMGRDFAFLGRQVRITVGNKDYYIDLLFYHRKLRRLVLIELKLGEFLPEHKGQVELYLRWLQKYEMAEGEESPIGIILCAQKDQSEIELLELDKSGIHVAEYMTQLPPKDLLQQKLTRAIEVAKERMATREIEGE